MLNIIDPLTNNTYNLFSKLGKETLKKYIMQFQNGGSMGETILNINFEKLKYYINNISTVDRGKRRDKYINAINYLETNYLDLKLEISVDQFNNIPKKIRVFISDDDESDSPSEFKLEHMDGLTWHTTASINENRQKKGLSRLFHFILITHFVKYITGHLPTDIIIGIPENAGAGFWESLRFTPGRYGMDPTGNPDRWDSPNNRAGNEIESNLQVQYNIAMGII
jgi:hypothetical protein